MLAEPELSAVADEVKPPLERTTEPVGVPLVLETAMVTPRFCALVMLLDAGVTVTVGVVPRQIHIRTARRCFLTVKAIEGSAQLSEFGGDVFGQLSSVFCLV